MGEAAASTEAAIHELRASLDLLHGNVARIDTTQQQLVAQVDLMSAAVQDGAKTNADTVRQLTALQDRLLAVTHGIDRVHGRPPSPEEDDADPDQAVLAGKATMRPAQVTWTGDTPGASSAHAAVVTGGDGLLGGGGFGGA
jgi:hypothetical protein